MKHAFALSALLIVSAPAAAMPTSAFISRWEAASHLSKDQAQGLTAAAVANRPEVKALFVEFSDAAQAYRRQILDARTAGRAPRACPPKDVNLTIDGVVADIRRLPADWQSRELSDSFGAAMDRRFPCSTPGPK